MNHKEIINKIKPELDKVISFFEKELSGIRTSRATPSLVEDVIVKCFDQTFPLKQLAAISTPESKQILIEPWDSSYIEGIVKALEKTGTGANPIVDKNAIRINLPPLSEEYRKDLFRILSEKKEQVRQTIRKWREKSWEEIQEGFKKGEIREDDKFRAKDELQELVQEYNEKVEQIEQRKKKEILE